MYAPLIINSSSQNTKGVGMYKSSNWVTPQRYQSPFGGAKVEVPAGWGTGLGCSCGCGGGPGCAENGLGDDGGFTLPNISSWLPLVASGIAAWWIFKQDRKEHKKRQKERRKPWGYQ